MERGVLPPSLIPGRTMYRHVEESIPPSTLNPERTIYRHVEEGLPLSALNLERATHSNVEKGVPSSPLNMDSLEIERTRYKHAQEGESTHLSQVQTTKRKITSDLSGTGVSSFLLLLLLVPALFALVDIDAILQGDQRALQEQIGRAHV